MQRPHYHYHCRNSQIRVTKIIVIVIVIIIIIIIIIVIAVRVVKEAKRSKGSFCEGKNTAMVLFVFLVVLPMWERGNKTVRVD